MASNSGLSAAESQRSPKSRFITDDEWDQYKPILKTLRKTWTTRRIKDYLEDTYGFTATERQYKGRFNNWGWPRKNLLAIAYMAMWRILIAFKLSGTFSGPFSFRVQTGHKRAKKCSESRIKKELQRHENIHQAECLDIADAFYTLDEWTVSIVCASVELNIQYVAQHYRLTATLPDLNSPLIPRSQNPLNTATLPNSFEESSETPLVGVGGASLLVDVGSTSGPGTTELLFDAHSFIPARQSTLFPEAQDHLDYDLGTDLDHVAKALRHISISHSMAAHATCPARSGFEVTPLRRPVLNRQKANLGHWVAPYVLPSFSRDDNASHDCLIARKHAALEQLSHSLDAGESNRYLLPSLLWTLCVLQSHHRRSELQDFLNSSTEMVVEKTGRQSALSITFEFHQAWVNSETTTMRRLGELLIVRANEMASRLADRHPNVIVVLYHWSWHLVETRDYATAQANLETCLAESANIMGSHSLLAIHCMVMLGRIYAETGYHDQAIMTLKEALHILGQPSMYLAAYRLTMMQRLAESEAFVGAIRDAEQHLREALEGRLAIFGLMTLNNTPTDATWESIVSLQKLLCQANRHDEAQALADKYNTLWAEQRKAWYLSRGYAVPPDNVTWQNLGQFEL